MRCKFFSELSFHRGFHILLSIAIIAVTLPPSSSLILDCTYTQSSIWFVNAYSCSGKVIFVNDPRTIIEISGNHASNHNHSEVLQVSIRDQNIKIVPRHLGAFFPNLESLDMYKAGVETVSKIDFAGLANLKQLHFNDNKIKLLENDLFIGNPKMKWISFINNPVTNVGHNVFENLSELISLRFEGVTCHNAPASNDPVVAKALIHKLYASCPPTLDMTFKKIKEKIFNEADRVDKGKAIQIDVSMNNENQGFDNEIFEIKRMLNDHENRLIKLENDEKLGIRNLFQ